MCAVGEAVGPGIVGGGRIGERAVGIERHRAMGRSGDQLGGERIVFRVAVIGQETGRGVDCQRGVFSRGVGIPIGRGRALYRAAPADLEGLAVEQGAAAAGAGIDADLPVLDGAISRRCGVEIVAVLVAQGGVGGAVLALDERAIEVEPDRSDRAIVIGRRQVIDAIGDVGRRHRIHRGQLADHLVRDGVDQPKMDMRRHSPFLLTRLAPIRRAAPLRRERKSACWLTSCGCLHGCGGLCHRSSYPKIFRSN